MTAHRRCPEIQAVISAFFSGMSLTREELLASSNALMHAEGCSNCLRIIAVATKLDLAFDEDPDAVHRSIERITEEFLARLPSHRWPTVAAAEPVMQHDDVIT